MSDDNVGVAVLGMGRSGTSAVTRMFVSAGFFAGRDEDLMEATEANPTGHWENLNVWRVNERILGRLGGTWFDPPSEDQQLAARVWATSEVLAVFEKMVEEANNAPVALKDPRIGVMLPLWGEIIEARLHPVLVIRDPIEIARSLNRRDGSPTSFALAAWQLHMTTALRHLQGRVVTVVPYGRLLGCTRLAELVVRSTLGHLRDDVASHVKFASSLITPDSVLHRNRVASGDHEHELSVHQLELWSELASLGPGDNRIDVPENLLECGPAVLGSVRAETERQAVWARVQAAEQASAAARERSEALTLELAGMRERINALSTEVAAQSAQAETAEAAKVRAEGWLEAMQTSASWRVTAPLRAGKRTIRRLLRIGT
jgi:hypothetical protein